MKIAFVMPLAKTPYSILPEPPLGLAYLAACLLKAKENLQIEIIDGFILDQDEYHKKISNIEADIVGVSTTILELGQALMIPNMVREKDTNFIIGGPGVADLPSSRFYENGYSVICYGEGEKTIVELVNAIKNGLPLEGIKGISYLERGFEIKTPPREPIKNLDEIPFPARELLDMEKYLSTFKKNLGVRIASIISSRGCPFSCRFCDKTPFGDKIRFMSPPRIIEEMKILYEIYGAEMIFFEDDLLTINRRRVLEFCRLMEKDLPGKLWGAQSRVDTVDKEMLAQMKHAGCTYLIFGVESGSQKILDLLGKGITIEQIENAFKWAKETGIKAGMYLMIGIPGETQEDIEMTKRIMEKSELTFLEVAPLTPIPGTKIYEMTKHLIRDGVDLNNYNFTESIYRRDIFDVSFEERNREIMDFFFTTSKDRANPGMSIFWMNANRPDSDDCCTGTDDPVNRVIL